jgi:hypothetical protein
MENSAPLAFFRSTAAVTRRAAEPRPVARPRKAYTRRRGDVSQQVRFGVQLAFLLIAVWVGAQFYLWVRHYETAGSTLKVSRPPGVEAWPSRLMNGAAAPHVPEERGRHVMRSRF